MLTRYVLHRCNCGPHRELVRSSKPVLLFCRAKISVLHDKDGQWPPRQMNVKKGRPWRTQDRPSDWVMRIDDGIEKMAFSGGRQGLLQFETALACQVTFVVNLHLVLATLEGNAGLPGETELCFLIRVFVLLDLRVE